MKKIKKKILKSVKKRFRLNSNNIIKFKHSNTKHLLTKKDKKNKRHLKKICKKNINNFKRINNLIK